MYAAFIAWTFLVGVVGGFLAVLSWLGKRAEAQNRLGQSREPLPCRVPVRVVTPESCGCDECDALVEQIQLTVAIAIARAEVATIDRERAELNGDVS